MYLSFPVVLKSIIKALPFLMSGYCLPSFAWTYMTEGEGVVFIHGKVLYSPCAIDLDSLDQTIDLGNTPVSEIAAKGFGPARDFTVRLINCLMQPKAGVGIYDSEYYQITFDPMTGTNGFNVTGDAQGIQLTIRDTDGNLARPGVAFPAKEVTAGSTTLKYTLQVISNGQPLKSGNYQSLIRFRMDYY